MTTPRTIDQHEPGKTLKRVAARVEARLRTFFDEIENAPISTLFDIRAESMLFSQVKDLTLRSGKRLRAALLCAGATLFDPAAEEHPAVIDAACAMELRQTYLLIHDDIMDGDMVRRGGPTVHVALGGYMGDRRQGEALGILAGDLASSLEQVILSNLPLNESDLVRVFQIFSAMHLNVVQGQTLDMLGSTSAYEIATHKTASYTTIGPIVAGAAIAGAREKDLIHLAKIALPLGVAFQFRDDLLGTFGSAEATGKPSDSDLREGKRNALLEEAHARADRYQRQRIDEIWGKPDASDAEVETARDLFIQCGAKSALEEHVREMAEEFVAGLDRPYYSQNARAFLTAVAKYIAERNV